MVGATTIDICSTCGAVGHGNITCPTCKSTYDWLPDDSPWRTTMRIGLPFGTVEGSPYVAIVKSINRHNEKLGLI